MTLQPLIDADVHSIPNFLLVVWYLQIWSKAKGSMCVWFHPIDLSTFSLTKWKEMIQPLKEAPRSLIRPSRFVLHRSVYLTPFNHMFDSLQWLHQCGCGKKISHSGNKNVGDVKEPSCRSLFHSALNFFFTPFCLWSRVLPWSNIAWCHVQF